MHYPKRMRKFVDVDNLNRLDTSRLVQIVVDSAQFGASTLRKQKEN